MDINISLNRIFKAWLLFNVALFIVAPISAGIEIKALGVLSYIIFYGALILFRRNNMVLGAQKANKDNGWVLFLIFFQMLMVSYALEFYVGNTILGVMKAFFLGENNYQAYQEFFKDNDLSSMSWSKVPAILSLAGVKIIFIYSAAMFFLNAYSSKALAIFSLSILPMVFMAIGRGTFFEVFEVSAIIAYGTLIGKRKINLKNVIFFSLVIIIIIAGFVLNTMRRYDDAQAYFSAECATYIYCFSPIGINSAAEYIVYILSVYFSMGIFFIGHYMYALLGGELLGSLVPHSLAYAAGMVNIGLEHELCSNFVDCRAVWMPQMITIISFFGVIIAIPVFWIFIFCIEKMEANLYKNDVVIGFCISCMLLIYMLSLPNGKFWSVSSSNILTTVFFLSVYGAKTFVRKI